MFKLIKKVAVKLGIINTEVYIKLNKLSTIKAKAKSMEGEIAERISKRELDHQKFLSQREAEMKVADASFRIEILKLEEERRENLRVVEEMYAEIENSMSPEVKAILGIKDNV